MRASAGLEPLEMRRISDEVEAHHLLDPYPASYIDTGLLRPVVNGKGCWRKSSCIFGRDQVSRGDSRERPGGALVHRLYAGWPHDLYRATGPRARARERASAS